MSSMYERWGGYTAVPDSMARQHGLAMAVVFGRIARFCGGAGGGVCRASLERIGLDIGLKRNAVGRHVQRLVELGYLDDTTPDLRNHPHTYRVTGKLGGGETELLHQNGAAAVPKRSSRCTETVHEEKTKKKHSVRKPGVAAPRHPAVLAYNRAAHLWPSSAQCEPMAQTVGDNPDRVELWERVVRGYVLKGWNPRNIAGMLEFFGRGAVPGTSTTSNSGHKAEPGMRMPDGY